MPFCPRCKYEYTEGTLMCPDCSEKLVDALPSGATSAVQPDDSWVVVGRVQSDVRSEMAKGALDSNNIPSVVLSNLFNAYGKGMDLLWNLSPSDKEGSAILVPREFREEALIILEAVLGDEFRPPREMR